MLELWPAHGCFSGCSGESGHPLWFWVAMKPSYARLRVLAVFVRNIVEQPQRGANELCGADLTRITGLGSGSIYPILEALEGNGFLTSHWEILPPEQLGRPQRRLYAITAKGFREYVKMAQAVRLT